MKISGETKSLGEDSGVTGSLDFTPLNLHHLTHVFGHSKKDDSGFKKFGDERQIYGASHRVRRFAVGFSICDVYSGTPASGRPADCQYPIGRLVDRLRYRAAPANLASRTRACHEGNHGRLIRIADLSRILFFPPS